MRLSVQAQQKQERATIGEAELISRRIHTVIAKRDYIRADQALTDGFYEGFYSDGSLSSRIEQKRVEEEPVAHASQVKPPEPPRNKT